MALPVRGPRAPEVCWYEKDGGTGRSGHEDSMGQYCCQLSNKDAKRQKKGRNLKDYFFESSFWTFLFLSVSRVESGESATQQRHIKTEHIEEN